MNILITYITVCLNSEKTITKCLKSIISQKNRYVEYIVIDGKSLDKTFNIIKKYKGNIDYVISKKDKGMYHAMNEAVKKSKGKYLCFINSDDWLNKKSNSIIINNIKNYPSVDIFYGNQDIYRKNKFLYCDNANHYNLKSYMSISHQSCYIKRKIFDNKKYSNKLKLSSDYEFFLYLYLRNFSFKKIEHSFTSFRIGGLSSNQSLMMKEFLWIQKKYNNLIIAKINYVYRYKFTFIKLFFKKIFN